MSKNIQYRDYIVDYLIPVITMIKKGINHTEAFHEVAYSLGVTYQTVNDRCARGLSLYTAQFVAEVHSGKIKERLLNKFPGRVEEIYKYL